MKKALILFLILFILVLLQTSFLVHFNIFGFVPNLVIIFVIFLDFFEKEKNFFSPAFFNSLFGGLFLDVFSRHQIGFYIIILIGLYIFVKIIKKHVRTPVIKGF